ncbi:MAG TPA: BTAD domain-containing putative transcriptional regulator [Kofleriaceae bacterium]|nr:BTAD domain-containing putative transcriptional regulator [Kofleriaceae bacterium]
MLAYLTLNPSPVSRSRLCDLLWDAPNDPRGELRWCLSKLRAVIDDDDRRRIITEDDTVALDLSGCLVDAAEVDRALRGGVDALPTDRLAGLCDLFRGDLLEGLHIDGSHELTGWLGAQRQRYRGMRVELLEALIRRAATPAEAFARLDAWLELAPFDRRAHEVMLSTLVRSGRLRDAEEHLAASIRSFEAEGIDWLPLRDAWKALREAPPPQQPAPPPAAALPAPAVTEPSRIVLASGTEPPPVGAEPGGRTRRRAAVAVMPFVDRIGDRTGDRTGDRAGGDSGRRIADGVTEDIIMQLAKLRGMFVIARGSVFALSDRAIGPQEAGRLLGVDYVTSGSVRGAGAGGALTISVELADAHDGHVVWTDEVVGAAGETFGALDTVVGRIVAAIAEEIETAEVQRAVLKAPSSLDAWEAYHRGLWHMYKFNGPDNRDAEQYFRASIRLDPMFARAHAGLAFTHFQNAFLGLTPDRAREIDLSYEAATHSLSADDADPAAHWAMGRALWLRGAQGDAIDELKRSVELSPSFALGHYTLGFVEGQSGDPAAAIAATNFSRRLSPFDPLQFAMLATRAYAHLRLDQRAEAADWAVRATARPNAHAHILAIAAQCLALAGRIDEARRFVARIRERLPRYDVEEFLRSFRFDKDAERLFRSAARSIDFGG